MKQRHGRIAHVLGRYPSVYSLRVFLTNHFFLCCPYTSPFLRIPPSKPKKKNHLGSSIAATHTTDKRSECSHHLRSSHTTSPCLCSTSIFFWAYRYLLGLPCKVPSRPRAFLARTYSQISPNLPSLNGLSNCSGRSADTIYRRFMLACLLLLLHNEPLCPAWEVRRYLV